MLLAAVSLGSNGTYFPTQGHIIGVMAALCVVHGIINCMSTAWLNHITKSYAIFHICILVAACISLLVMNKDKHSASYAFTNVEPASGWTPPGFSFLFGLLSVAWTMTDYDATAQCVLPVASRIAITVARLLTSDLQHR